MKDYKFWLSCPQMTGELVQYMTDPDRAEQITYSTFARHADLAPMRKEKHPAMYRVSCESNWAISFWRSRLPSGVRVYYFDWSRIEHVFVSGDVSFGREVALLEEAA